MADRGGTAGTGTDGAAAPQRRVRRAVPADVAAMDAMVHELAAYEREPDAVQASPRDLHEALFADAATASALVAEVADVAVPGGWEVVGMAVSFTTYSTWTGRCGTWLEDLYVRPEHRGAGLGRALLAALAAQVVEAGQRRLEWAVLDWNTPAQGVYAAVGARPQEEWTTWRLTGQALHDLARGGAPGPVGPARRSTMGDERADEGVAP